MNPKLRTALALIGVVFVTGVVFATFGCESQETRRADHQERATSYYEQKRWAEAKIELLNLVEMDPENAQAREQLGDSQVNLQEYANALWQYREAVRLDPTDIPLRIKLAGLYLSARQPENAREQIDEALKQDPNHVTALIQRGRASAQADQIDAALADYDRALELDPQEVAAYKYKYDALREAERFIDAELTLRSLVEARPDAGSHSALGSFLHERGRPDEAEPLFRKAVELAEEGDQRRAALIQLAEYLYRTGKIEASEAALLTAREEAPDHIAPLASLARFYVLIGDRDKAVAILEERVTAEPEEPAHLMVLARFHQRGGERGRALEAVERALAVEPNYEEARILRAEYLIQDLEDEDARAEGHRIIEEVLESNPSSVRGLFSQAKLMLADEKYEEAANLLRRVVEEQPEASVYFLLGTAYLRQDQRDLAREQFLSALDRQETHIPARTQLAALYLATGNRELAAQEARTGLGMQPNNARLSLILTEALIGLRDPEGAREQLDRLPLATDQVSRPLRLRSIRSFLQLGDVARAREIVKVILDEDPTDAGALGQAIVVEARAKEPMKALPMLARALEHDPEDAELYLLRGSFYLGFRRQSDGTPLFPQEAQADLLTALDKKPDSGRTHVLLGRLRQFMGQKEQGLDHYRKAIRLNPKSPEPYLRAGILYEETGRLEAAIDNYTKLLDETNRVGITEQELAIAMNNLAWLLADRDEPTADDLTRAERLAQDARQLLPQEPSIADTLGWVMHKRNIPTAAIPLFQDAIDSQSAGTPARALSRYHLGLSYELNGQADKAIQELERSLREAKDFPGRDNAEQALDRLREL